MDRTGFRTADAGHEHKRDDGGQERSKVHGAPRTDGRDRRVPCARDVDRFPISDRARTPRPQALPGARPAGNRLLPCRRWLAHIALPHAVPNPVSTNAPQRAARRRAPLWRRLLRLAALLLLALVVLAVLAWLLRRPLFE